MVVLGLLAAGFFGIIGSGRYLISRSKRRLVGYEMARRHIEQHRPLVRADLWYAGGGNPLQPDVGWLTGWGCGTVVGGILYESRIRVDSVGGVDSPRRVTVQVRWNEIKI